ncbi:hypothetical protein [Longimicrobium sp.]|uniref:hypothetical protein n=1 Tax=Longimicrobium sp. TaxID=2029185 RepID=UPI002E30A2EC|nr:hypothetical protein [Longimicrobium sp.]HEX6040049.1 hypothetical protein [Longimicrobium sp.]
MSYVDGNDGRLYNHALDVRVLAHDVESRIDLILMGVQHRSRDDALATMVGSLQHCRDILPTIPGGAFQTPNIDAVLQNIETYRSTGRESALKMAKRTLQSLSKWADERAARSEAVSVDRLVLTVDPGSAPPEEIADILSDLSILYRRMGGSGINFTPQDVHIFAAVDA